MLPGELAEFLSKSLHIKTGTVLDRAKILRAAEPPLLGKNGRGPRSGARMTGHDAVNSTLANVIECERGKDLTKAVRRLRNLRREKVIAVPDTGILTGLMCFVGKTAGEALDGLLSDIRSGRINTREGTPDIRVSVDLRGASLVLSFSLPKRHELDFRTASASFGAHPKTAPAVARQATLSGSFFMRLAEALGPPS